ncbi:hypothetical protein N473_01440 [Pseudoalteromonas luteoviolacea CPMOR-1]|uniref:Uncharacterized protein n=1 Tax=Pseudoalteromonas luteoviolacea CPMOR-1 TaxID=1365248 RepID=A0A167LUZ0_9GAMM|nr:hypothetical protein [Pseudoalteromonas luteoviolacea]KZN65266.1 hypothetical protein N473_01440 [Pseudoalteromonas luteoviolacea CPMOR-1]
MNKNPYEKTYTSAEYAEVVCKGKIKPPAVRAWIRKWRSQGGLPANHRLDILPNGKVLIVVTENRTHSQLVTHLVANR